MDLKKSLNFLIAAIICPKIEELSASTPLESVVCVEA
jgi:hypothetical protein